MAANDVRTGRRWRVSPYVGVATVLAAVMTSHTLNRQWSGDAQAHLAAIVAVARNPLTPEEPFVGGTIPSPYLSPWSVVWGALSGVTGLDAETILVLSGLVNLAALLFAFRLFTRELGFTDLASALALVAAVVLWGVQPWRWSGFVSLTSLGFGLPYPSATGYALMLLTWVATLRWLRVGRAVHIGALVPLVALLVLIHPFSAMNAAVGTGAMLIWRARDIRSVLVVALAWTAGGLVTLLWPYFSILEAAAAGDAYDVIHLTFYQRSELPGLALVAVGLPALLARWRHDRRDVLAWLLVLAAGVYLLGWATNAGLGRVLPVLVLGPQLALAQRLATPSQSTGWRVWQWTAATSLVAGLVLSVPGLTRAIPAALLPESIEQALRFREPAGSRTFERAVAPEQVVLSTDQAISRGLVAQGTWVVEPPYIQPLIPDLEARAAATVGFAGMEADERRRVIDQYSVDWVVVPVGTSLDVGGGVVSDDGRLTLVPAQEAVQAGP